LSTTATSLREALGFRTDENNPTLKSVLSSRGD
jgi:hypothetical protein